MPLWKIEEILVGNEQVCPVEESKVDTIAVALVSELAKRSKIDIF